MGNIFNTDFRDFPTSEKSKGEFACGDIFFLYTQTRIHASRILVSPKTIMAARIFFQRPLLFSTITERNQ